MPLTEEKRQQLDGIVQEMIKNKESDEDIQFVVDDFINIHKSDTEAPLLEKQPSVGEKGIPGVFTGAGMGVISSIKKASAFGERGLRAGLKAILPKSLESSFGVSEKEFVPASEQLIPEELTTAVTPAQKAGFIGEQISEFFIPGAAPTKIGKTAEALVKGGKLLKGAVKLGATALGEAGLALGQTALQKGKFDKEAQTAGLLGLFTPPAVKLAGTAVKVAGKGAAEVLGKATGAASEAIVEAFKNPAVAGFMRKAGKSIGDFQNDVLGQVRTGLSKLRQIRSQEYQQRLANIKLQQQQIDGIIEPIRDNAVGLMDNFDISILPQADEIGNKLNILDFSKSTLIEGANVVEKALNDVMSWTDNTAIGLDKLKQRLGIYADQLIAPGKERAKLFVNQLKDSVKIGLESNVPGYKEMTSGYAQASDLIDTVNQVLSLKNEKARETAIKKIFGALRQNNEQRKEFLKVLGEAGGFDIIAKIAGGELAPLAPKGLAGALFPKAAFGGGAVTLLNPQTWPLLFTYIAVSSPRLVGELTNIAGRITDQMVKLNKFSPEIQRALRELIIKSQEEEELLEK